MPELQDYEELPAVDTLPPTGPIAPPAPNTQPVPPPALGPPAVFPPAPKPVTFTGTPETFYDPSYQQKLEREMLAIRQRASNVEQADKDVASARRMLGMLKADRERQAMEKAGVPPAEAMQKSLFQNMSYLVQPTDKNFESSMKAVRPPPPAPTVQNFSIPGSKDTVPAFVTQDANGVRRVQIVPGSALPKEDFKASVEEIAPGVKAAKLGPNHYQLLERPGVQGSLDAVTKTQIELWKSDRKALQAAMQNRTGEAKKALQAQVDGLETKIMEAAKGGRVQAGQRRLKWNPETKDFE